MKIFYKIIQSPVGPLKIVANTHGLCAVVWENDNPKRVPLDTPLEDNSHPVLRETEKQLSEYFGGHRTTFDIPLDFKGTEFQKKVWYALLTIPYAQTRSYLQIATQIGNPKAVRAVGAANGKNPISIIAPCHRVIGANGALVGFAGGLDRKTCLLEIEASSRVMGQGS